MPGPFLGIFKSMKSIYLIVIKLLDELWYFVFFKELVDFMKCVELCSLQEQ